MGNFFGACGSRHGMFFLLLSFKRGLRISIMRHGEYKSCSPQNLERKRRLYILELVNYFGM